VDIATATEFYESDHPQMSREQLIEAGMKRTAEKIAAKVSEIRNPGKQTPTQRAVTLLKLCGSQTAEADAYRIVTQNPIANASIQPLRTALQTGADDYITIPLIAEFVVNKRTEQNKPAATPQFSKEEIWKESKLLREYGEYQGQSTIGLTDGEIKNLAVASLTEKQNLQKTKSLIAIRHKQLTGKTILDQQEANKRLTVGSPFNLSAKAKAEWLKGE
jgi:hypothetical protein